MQVVVRVSQTEGRWRGNQQRAETGINRSTQQMKRTREKNDTFTTVPSEMMEEEGRLIVQHPGKAAMAKGSSITMTVEKPTRLTALNRH